MPGECRKVTQFDGEQLCRKHLQSPALTPGETKPCPNAEEHRTWQRKACALEMVHSGGLTPVTCRGCQRSTPMLARATMAPSQACRVLVGLLFNLDIQLGSSDSG